jgi:hypothetical protein
MTTFEYVKSKNIDELVDWLDRNGASDYTPWDNWFDKNYCRKCKTVVSHTNYLEGEHEFCWCELYHKCMFFQDMDRTPDRKYVIRLWLESEAE